MVDRKNVLDGLMRHAEGYCGNNEKGYCPYFNVGDKCSKALLYDAAELITPAKSELRKKLPCTCGAKSPKKEEYAFKERAYVCIVCEKCGRKAIGMTDLSATMAWNEMVNDGHH